MLWIYSLSCVGHDTENSWTMSMELMVDNENEHPANGQHHCGLSPQLSLSHAGHLHLLLCLSFCIVLYCVVLLVYATKCWANTDQSLSHTWDTFIVIHKNANHAAVNRILCQRDKFSPVCPTWWAIVLSAGQ